MLINQFKGEEKDLYKAMTIPTLGNESWIKLNTDLYPSIKDGYFISSKGRVFNYNTKKFIKTRCLNPEKHSSPYYKVNLQVSINNHSYSDVFLVHRLMMCSFYPTDNMDTLLVNHKDGDKCNDELSNLEWVTPSENVIHALKTGLFKPVYGENHCCATLTNKQVKMVIDYLLEHKYTHKQIAQFVGTTESIVDSISSGRAWKHLTKDIDFSAIKHRLPKRFTFDQIHACCEYFASHAISEKSIRRHCMDCLLSIGYTDPITESVINSIRLLFTGQRYQYISKNYNFQ